MSNDKYVLMCLATEKNSKSVVKHHIEILISATKFSQNITFYHCYWITQTTFPSVLFVRSDRYTKKSSFVTLHLCTFHLWAQQTFRSRSVFSNGLKGKLVLSLGILSFAQTVHVHIVPSRVAVSSEAFPHRERILSTWTSRCLSMSTRPRFFPLNMFREKSLQHYCPLVMSHSHVFDLCTSCPSSFAWALKLDDIQRWRADPRELKRRVSARQFARIALKRN